MFLVKEHSMQFMMIAFLTVGAWLSMPQYCLAMDHQEINIPQNYIGKSLIGSLWRPENVSSRRIKSSEKVLYLTRRRRIQRLIEDAQVSDNQKKILEAALKELRPKQLEPRFLVLLPPKQVRI